MRDFLKEFVVKHDLYDADVVIFKHGEIIGNYNVFNDDVPMIYENDCMVRIASISKLFVATAIMQLQELRLLSIDDALDKYLDYPLRNPLFYDVPITIKMILTHTSSFKDTEILRVPIGESLKEIFHLNGKYYSENMFIIHQEKPVKPGTFYHYYNTGYQLLAEIIEKVSHQRFDQYINDHIMKPLSMKGSFNPSKTDIKDYVKPAYRKVNHLWIPQVDHEISSIDMSDYILGSNGSLFSPQGGLRTNAHELAKFMKFLMTGTPEILSQESIKSMLSIHVRVDERNTDDDFLRNNGIGFNVMEKGYQNHIIKDKNYTFVGHCGIAYGCLSIFFFDPDTLNGIIFITRGHGKSLSTYQGTYSNYFNFQEELFTYVDSHIWRIS